MTVLLICKTKQMFEKTLPFSNEVWYYKSKSEYMFGKYVRFQPNREEFKEEKEMTNTANTTQRIRRNKNHKFSKTMALILGVIVTLEVMVAGGMIFNIDFHSADIIALIFGFIVVFSGAVAILTDN